jgi:hypothetical protein
MDGAPQQADEVGASQLTQPPPVLTQPSQLAAGGATPAGGEASPACGGATPAGGGATPDGVGSSQVAMATPSPDQLGPRVVRAPNPWTYDQDHTWSLPPWGTAPNVHFSKLLIRAFIFRKS